MDGFDAADGQHVAGWRAREFIGAVAGANGDRQRIELRGLDKLRRLFGVGQHLAVVEFAHCAHAVLFARFAGFQRAQATEFAFHRGTNRMGHGHHFLCDAHVVVKA